MTRATRAARAAHTPASLRPGGRRGSRWWKKLCCAVAVAGSASALASGHEAAWAAERGRGAAGGAVLSGAGGSLGREAPELRREVRITAQTAPESLTVGDHVGLEVHVDVPAGWQVRFPERVEEGGPVDLVDLQVVPPRSAKRDGRDAKAEGGTAAPGRALWTARYTLAVFRVGDVTLPPWPVEVRADSLYVVATTDSLPLHVQSILTDSLAKADLRDIKPQAKLRLSPWPWVVAGAAGLAALAGLVWWLRRRRRPRAEVVPLESLRPAHEVALEALRKLEAQRLPLDGKFKEYHLQLSVILRRYLEDGFGVAALEETTEEILFDLDRHGFDRATVKQVGAMCAESDLVKFARHEPTIEECMRSLEHGRGFVLATAARSMQSQEGAARAASGAGGDTPPAATATPATPPAGSADAAPSGSGPDLPGGDPA